MPDSSQFYITTAIDYPNSRPHIGTAFEKIGADVQARYRRMEGASVHFLMGNDENTIKVTQRARELGLEPKAYFDDMARQFKEVWRQLEISTTISSRPAKSGTTWAAASSSRRSTTPATSTRGSTRAITAEGCEAFKTEKEVAEGGGKCPNHPSTPLSWVEEENYYFRLSAYRDRLLGLLRRTSRVHPAGEPAQRDREPGRNRDSRTWPSLARGSPGASGFPSTPSRRSMSGSMPCSTTSRRSATAPTRSGSAGSGRPTCTSSARTSRGSTAPSGRPC